LRPTAIRVDLPVKAQREPRDHRAATPCPDTPPAPDLAGSASGAGTANRAKHRVYAQLLDAVRQRCECHPYSTPPETP
jgi:hypothetical protein